MLVHETHRQHTHMPKCSGTDLGEMAGHNLAGTQSQTVLCCLGQVVQQAETHCCYVQLVDHTVLQFDSAAGKLAEKKGCTLSFKYQIIKVKQQDMHTCNAENRKPQLCNK